ncbi:MAG: class I SAM-dependent methyltransferase [Chloroflexia bacterium]|nr:class I SAM-dependent methyltransferase [Chloroflexia bacterium]
MFVESATVYDANYGSRHDVAADGEKLHGLIASHSETDGASLLDVACGTGLVLGHLRHRYAVEGLDLSPDMLAVARRKLPAIPFYQADMASFDLGRQFDVVICLGSSIGYVASVSRLQRTLRAFADHTRPGGVVVVEPWFSPDQWQNGRLTADLTDEPDLKIARILVSGVQGRLSTLDIHYLVAQPSGVTTFTEHHALGLFTHDGYLAAFAAAGLTVTHDPAGLLGRGLYLGAKP